MNEFTLELRHDGERWFLDVTNAKGEHTEVCISHTDKEALDEIGVGYFGE